MPPSSSIDETQLFARDMVRTWAEATLRQAERLDAAFAKWSRANRDHDRIEDWSPTEEDLERVFREAWAESHQMVWAAYQLERWRRRLHELRTGREVPDPDKTLQDLRNALEHLDAAAYRDGRAVAPEDSDPRKLRALRKLGGLDIVVGGGDLFGEVFAEDLKKTALARVAAVEAELEEDAAERYLALAEGETIKEHRFGETS